MNDADRRRHLAQLRERQVARIAPLAARNDDGPRPLSPEQERLWFLGQLEEDRGQYNLLFAVRVRGRFDLAAWDHAVSGVVARHAVLRTRFASADGKPRQVAEAARPFASAFVDLAIGEGGEPALHAALQAMATQPFDLARAPLLRGLVVRTADDEHVLALCVHHIVADGWSFGVFAREVSALYRAARGEAVAPLPPLPVQYADYAEWQREQAGGAAWQASLQYWRQALAGVAALCNLPLDRPRTPVPSHAGGVRPLGVAADLHERVLGFARSQGVSPFTVLLAAFFALLHRLSGDTDLCVGTPVANRRASAVEPLIGFFVNMVALRCAVQSAQSFADLLPRVAATLAQALEHQAVPFAEVVRTLKPARSLSHAPFFQIVFSLQNTPAQHLDLGGVAVEPCALPFSNGAGAKYELVFGLAEAGAALAGNLEYASDLFRAESADQMAASFVELLRDALERPGLALGRLRLGAPAQLDAVDAPVLRGTDAVVEAAPFTGLPAMFAAACRRFADARAVVSEREELSYAALERRVEQLAAHLLSLGVRPHQGVAVCLARDTDLVVALLAVLRIGAAYVPMDPGYPEQRLQFILEDSRVDVAVTSDVLRPLLAAQVPCTVCLGPAFWDTAPHVAVPPATVHPEAVAYLIYTSGSTGRPKAVAIRHGSVDVFLRWAHRRFDAADHALALASTSVCFDLSVFELFSPLTCGGTVAIARNALHLATLPCAPQVTMLTTVPSAIAALARDRALPPGLRVANVAGEVLTRAVVDPLHACVPGVRVFNLYGPSEDTTFSTELEVAPGAGAEPTIGRPLPGTTARVLDAWGQAVPRGVVGELHLGGRGVARSYWRRPALTAQRFVPDPWGNGERLYRTGDLARWNHAGELEYIGRADGQVKLRGYRIELGEIESALAAQVGVAAAAAVVAGSGPTAQLCALYVAAADAGDEARQALALRAALAQRLPAFMVPARYLRVPQVPLTPNGKTDRARLLALATAAGADRDERPCEPLQDETQHHVAAIWREVLGVAQVGASDDFFERGGHSLLATQVLARVRGTLGIELPLRVLFEQPTLAEFAAAVDRARVMPADADAPLQPRGPAPAEERLETSWAQQRLWFLHRLHPGQAQHNLATLVHLRGQVDEHALRTAFDRLVQRHEVLRTVLVDADGLPWQQVLPAARLGFVAEDVSGDGPAHARQRWQALARSEAEAAFDLARGPLGRVRLLRCAPGHSVLVVTLHHIVTDGWSMGVLVRELATHYADACARRPCTLPALPLQYADFARWQRAWLRGDRLARQLAYWQQQLDGSTGTLDLPLDRPRGTGADTTGAVHRFRIEGVALARLQQLAQQQQATLFMVLLAALAVVLARFTGQRDFNIGTPVANRRHADLEGLIGFFVNTLVLRCRIEGEPTFAQWLQQVKIVTLQAQDHQDLPFEQLVEALHVRRDLQRPPLFQVMLALQNSPMPALELPGLRIAPEALPPLHSAYEMTWQFAVDGQGLAGAIEYRAALFAPETVRSLAEACTGVLRAFADDPRAPIGDANAAGAQALGGGPPLGQQAPLLEQLAGIAATHASRPAVRCGEVELTHAELHRRALAVAAALRARGVGREERIGVCLERSVDLAVAVLGVLHAGAAYVPLDPHSPRERLRHVVQDAAPRFVLAHAPTRELAGALDAACLLLEEMGDGSPCVEKLGDDRCLAYVVHTSGSTGRPKGVGISRASLSNLAHAQIGLFGIAEDSRVCQFASLGFDASVSEIFTAVLAGACLAVPRQTRDVPEFLLELDDQQVTHATLPPALLQAVAPAPLPHLRTLVSAGEDCNWDIVRRWGAGRRFLNAYGPTEVTVCATSAQVQAGAHDEGRVPIGTPLPGVRLHVLDAALQPCIRGAVGELCIAGHGLARGYLGQPAQTALRFVPDPWGPPGSRMYCSGDLVRWRADGQLEYIGRNDSQVKIRGVRVEPGEVEHALLALPGVVQAAVVVRHEPEPALHAYVTGTFAPEQLRAQLAACLPQAMLPQLHAVPSLPTNASGKIDRQALKEMDAPPPPPRSCAAPQTPIERLLCEAMARVLQRDAIGLHDNFFEVGGNSLAAVRLIDDLHRSMELPLQVRDVFLSPTPAGLAAIAQGQVQETDAWVPLATGAVALRPVLCLPTLAGEVGIYRDLARALGGTVHGLRADGWPAGPPRLQDLAEAIVAQLLPAWQARGRPALLGWSWAGSLAFEVARCLQARGHFAPLVLVEPALWDDGAGFDDPARVAALLRAEWAAAATAFPRETGRYTGPAVLNRDSLAGVPDTMFEELLLPFRHRLAALRGFRPQAFAGPALIAWACDGTDRDGRRAAWHDALPRAQVRILPGDHRSLVTGAGSAALAACVQTFLGEFATTNDQAVPS